MEAGWEEEWAAKRWRDNKDLSGSSARRVEKGRRS